MCQQSKQTESQFQLFDIQKLSINLFSFRIPSPLVFLPSVLEVELYNHV